MKMARCAILLSTYNGERFLQQQLMSLEQQTYKDWDLIVRDDGSKDGTRNILQKFVRTSSHKVAFIDDSLNLGASKSFLNLLERAEEGDYASVFFCDQDDVWKPFKLEQSIKKMNELEAENDLEPILIHTDLEIVDQNLNRIYPSMWQANNTDPRNNQPNNYLVENNVTGCTIALNRAAIRKITAISRSVQKDKIVMHDWWSALIVSIFGKVAFIDKSTICYRQHSHNTIGLNKQAFLSKLNSRFIKEKNALINQAIGQAQELHRYLLETHFDQEQILSMVADYATILGRSPLARYKILRMYKMRKTSFIDNLGYKTILLLKTKR